MNKETKLTPYTVTETIWMVPCIVSKNSKEFHPLAKPFEQAINLHQLHTRQTWLPEEDEALRAVVEARGAKAWSIVAREVNKAVHQGIPIRQGKQCRERYFNHIDPNLKRDKWSPDEDLLVMEQQQKIGNRWSEIAKFLPGRTENQVKNRFKGLLKRGKEGCPRGVDPIAHLLQQVQKPSCVVSSPASTNSKSEIDFSMVADQILSLAPSSPVCESADVSPSTLLACFQA